MEIDRRGCTRIVILTKRYAFKIPRITSWEGFLLGCLANLNERKWQDAPKVFRLCPLLFSNRLGFLNVMPRCKRIRHTGFYRQELISICLESTVAKEFYLSDAKPENYGMYNGRMVKLDYGS